MPKGVYDPKLEKRLPPSPHFYSPSPPPPQPSPSPPTPVQPAPPAAHNQPFSRRDSEERWHEEQKERERQAQEIAMMYPRHSPVLSPRQSSLSPVLEVADESGRVVEFHIPPPPPPPPSQTTPSPPPQVTTLHQQVPPQVQVLYMNLVEDRNVFRTHHPYAPCMG